MAKNSPNQDVMMVRNRYVIAVPLSDDGGKTAVRVSPNMAQDTRIQWKNGKEPKGHVYQWPEPQKDDE